MPRISGSPARQRGDPQRVVELPYQPPYHHAALLRFLEPRAVTSLETVTPTSYERHNAAAITIDNGIIQAKLHPPTTTAKLRRFLDLDADSVTIDQHLAKSPLLRPIVKAHPGIRIPGCWDGFELAIRAILGQQVTVKGATTLMNRLVTQWGAPNPATLADAPVETIGLPSKRAETIRTIARAVAAGDLPLDHTLPPNEIIDRICALPGLGPWTANYIAMRALHAEDAFPASDLGLLKAAGVAKPKDLERLAEPWRPYRAYAAFLLWHSL
jgi:3-methyladenine DNA glycosylase/8-oxoguanine DNA glycosylase